MSVNRALHIIRAVARAGGTLTPTEIAAKTEIPRASVYRLINTLEVENILHRTADRTYVEITPEFLNLMITGASTQQIVAGFHETLSCTANTWEATAFLARLDGTAVEIVHTVAPCRTTAGYVRPGHDIRPAHACSASRAILAFLPDERRAAILGSDFTAFTDKTVTDPDKLQYELALTRERAFAICDEEIDPGITSVAAPVIMGRAGVVYSLGIVSFTGRIHDHGIAAIGTYLHAKAQTAAQNASQNLFETAA